MVLKRRFALGVVLAASVSGAEPGLKIAVFVYNYASISSEALARAKAEAGRIYRHAGIDLEWLNCPLSQEQAAQYPDCGVAPARTRLALRILSRSMAERLRQDQDSFGFALYPEDGGFAIVANVFAHNAEELARRRALSHGVILGDLMAHELGHLLLGAGSHSAGGIMRVPWHKKELEIIAQGSLLFMPWEAERMRAQIRARMSSERAAR